MLGATLWGLDGYLQAYHRPYQNWLPQGSFRADPDSSPLGWTQQNAIPCVLSERTAGNLPLTFLHLTAASGEVSTQLDLESGWRMLHLSFWIRWAPTGPVPVGGIHGLFTGATGVVSEQIIRWAPSSKADGRWHQLEGVWTRPAGSRRLNLSLECRGDGAAIDMAELVIVPTFVSHQGVYFPTH